MSQQEEVEEALEEGFYFEVIDLEKERSGKIAKKEGIFEKLTQSISDKIFSFIPTLAKSIKSNIEGCENEPQEINCEFSVVVGGKARFFICQFSSQGQFKVNIKWTNPKK